MGVGSEAERNHEGKRIPGSTVRGCPAAPRGFWSQRSLHWLCRAVPPWWVGRPDADQFPWPRLQRSHFSSFPFGSLAGHAQLEPEDVVWVAPEKDPYLRVSGYFQTRLTAQKGRLSPPPGLVLKGTLRWSRSGPGGGGWRPGFPLCRSCGWPTGPLVTSLIPVQPVTLGVMLAATLPVPRTPLSNLGGTPPSSRMPQGVRLICVCEVLRGPQAKAAG